MSAHSIFFYFMCGRVIVASCYSLLSSQGFYSYNKRGNRLIDKIASHNRACIDLVLFFIIFKIIKSNKVFSHVDVDTGFVATFISRSSSFNLMCYLKLFCPFFCQLIYVGCVDLRELKTNPSTIPVCVLEVLSSSTKNGKSFVRSAITVLMRCFWFKQCEMSSKVSYLYISLLIDLEMRY